MFGGFFGFVMILMGSMFFIVGKLLIKFKNTSIKDHTVILNAKVVNIDSKQETQQDTDGHYHTSTLYRPVLKYEYQGKTYKVGRSSWSSRVPYKIGDDMEVKINPENPESIITDVDIRIYKLAGSIFSAIGGILVVISVILLFSNFALKIFSPLGLLISN